MEGEKWWILLKLNSNKKQFLPFQFHFITFFSNSCEENNFFPVFFFFLFKLYTFPVKFYYFTLHIWMCCCCCFRCTARRNDKIIYQIKGDRSKKKIVSIHSNCWYLHKNVINSNEEFSLFFFFIFCLIVVVSLLKRFINALNLHK